MKDCVNNYCGLCAQLSVHTSNTTGHYLVLRIRCMILLRSNNFHGLIKKDEASLINPAITVKLFMGPSVYQ